MALAFDRPQMHKELDRILDQVMMYEGEGYLPDLQVEYTNVDEHQQETIITFGVEFVELADDAGIQVEERFIHTKYFDEWGKTTKPDKHEEWTYDDKEATNVRKED